MALALCFRQTVCGFGLLLLQGGSFDLFVLLRMVQRGVADEFCAAAAEPSAAAQW